ncbi:ATP-binding protein [Thermococcus thioreducens]|uniref:ArsR family transcriptional regulator n=1 Tax=Thermococcus thioreducens TaxID=277988 RepID=A0A0Q2QS68_9EURY|nr:ATP-binding protein [Thermococcus thioreducens]ASJ13563.1 ArsR family transcriptional regulator [Thermococcus thioreducens]KQH82869.1 ArsR family transcriptional regulator [Thermococcus thioreducens]SEW20102.1 hypothetical protein SAMN05216170_2046 [Thermococcus thioreducens]
MIMQEFVNRSEELRKLGEYLKKRSLIIVYGRRRVGKTRLIIEALKGIPHVYHLCKEEEPRETLVSLSKKLYRVTGDIKFLEYPPSSFDELFNLLSASGTVLVLDEFPVLVKNYPRILGLLQEYWDFGEGGSIILCGSSVSMMKRLTDYGSPLHGRRTMTIKVKPLEFRHIGEFFPGYSPEELVRAYGVLDGIPEYLLRFDPSLSVEENVIREFFGKGYLYEEAELLLRYELRDLSTYNTILEAIASGYTSFNEIRTKTGIDGSKLSRYLSVLGELEIVRKEYPVLPGVSRRRKGARYSLSDNYFAFYYSFVYPFKEEIELGLSDVPLENFRRKFNLYLGRVYEKVALQHLMLLNRNGKLPFRFTRIGRWWWKGEEVDLVALDEKEKKALLVEVKWRKLGPREVWGIRKDLERKAALMGLDGWEVHTGIVAREFVERPAPLLWDIHDITGE